MPTNTTSSTPKTTSNADRLSLAALGAVLAVTNVLFFSQVAPYVS